MRRIIILSLFLLILGCEKDESFINDGTVIWRPNPVALIGDHQIQLNWFNSSILNKIIRPYTYVEPDHFEIYISTERADHFTPLVELTNDGNYSYKIEKLANDQSYYFYVVSKKKRYISLISDTIMAIPNQKTDTKNLITSGNSHSVTSVALASKINKIASVDKFYAWNGGSNCCMAVSILISNLDGSDANLLDIHCSEPCWSPNNDQLVFRSEKGETNRNYGMPSQIAVFDYQTKALKKLTSGEAFNSAPVFSKNGELILYQSSKNVPNDNLTNIWMINLKTEGISQITDMASLNLIGAGRPDWIDNEKFLFHAIGRDNKYQIYESSVTARQVSPVFTSHWNDYTPSTSPDNKRIAFVSDRSGSNQIWLYSRENKSLRQLTGFSKDEYIDHSWNRISWIDNQTILFTFNDNRLMRLKSE